MRLAVLALLFLAAAAGSARADMDIGMQDDNTIVYGYHNRELALTQFAAMGGTHVRMNLEHERNHDTRRNVGLGAVRPGIEFYDGAVNAVIAHGLQPQVTLIWRGQNDVATFARWARNVAKHLGTRVNRYSLLNEPDLLIDIDCTRGQQRAFARQFPRSLIGGKKVTRARVLTSTRGMPLDIACSRYRRGLLYHRLLERTAPALRAANPNVQVLGGETSAQPGLEWFVRGADPSDVGIDGWAHHPFQLSDLTPDRRTTPWGIGNLDLLRSIVHLPIFLTEFGYPHPNSSMDKKVFGRHITPRQVARTLPRAWKLARAAGAQQMLQYQWFVKPSFRGGYWETALLNRDDGKVTPAYKALKRLILGWRES